MGMKVISMDLGLEVDICNCIFLMKIRDEFKSEQKLSLYFEEMIEQTLKICQLCNSTTSN